MCLIKKNGIITFTLLLFVLAISTVHARKTYIEKIDFQGNTTFNKKELLSIIDSKPSSLFHKSLYSVWVIKSDITKLESFYKDQGFLNPQITYEKVKIKNNKRVRIIIKIVEGARVHIASLRIETNPVINESSLKSIFSRTGQPLLLGKLSVDALTLQDSVAGEGFLKASVYPQVVIDSMALKAYVIFHVNPGPRIRVGNIRINGLSTVNPVVVKRELEFKQGDILTLYKKSDSEQNLYKTRMFNFLNIYPVISDSSDKSKVSDTIVPVKIDVSQARYLSVDANIGYSGYEKFTVSQTTAYANLFGRAHVIALEANASGIGQRVALIYSVPWIFGYPLNVNFTAFYERQGNLFVTIPIAYTGVFDGFNIAAGQNRTKYFSYDIGLTWENTVSLSVPSPDTISGGIPQENTRSITANVVYDKRDNIFNPYNGFVNYISMTVAGFGGGVNKFVKVSNDLRGYYTFDSIVTLSSAVTVGYGFPYGSSTTLPVQEQFYAGGSRSVRGYNLNSLVTNSAGDPVGGNVLLVLHILEIQFPLFWLLKGAVFSDAGYVWSTPSEVNLRDVKFTAGPSLRLASPLGILRFDVGFQLDKLIKKGSFKMYLDVGRAF